MFSVETTAETAADRVRTLIDESAELLHSQYQLAKAIGYTPQEVNMWRAGSRACPIEAQALMAAVAGKDVDDVIHDALIERNIGTPRGEKLISALGKGLMSAGVVTLITVSASDVSASSSIAAVELLRCIFRAFL